MFPTTRTGGGLSLRKLFPAARFVGATDIEVSSVTNDPNACQRGCLFVATEAISEADLHDDLQQAALSGAVAAVTGACSLDAGLPQCVVDDPAWALGIVSHALAGNPSQHVKTIGLTGTSGKTTTSLLLASILGEAGYQTGLMGTLGYCDGEVIEPARGTTPAAPVVADWLARMRASGCSHAVLELSSRGLAARRAAGVELDMVAITNVRRERLDLHGSVVNYREAKRQIFQQLSPEGVAIFNADDPVCCQFLSKHSGPALTVAMDRPAEITASVVEQFISEQTFLLTAGSDSVPVRTTLIGRHNIYNCLVAAAAGLVYGIDLSTIVRGIEAVDKVPGRLERIECGQPFGVFVDYVRSADSLAASLAALRPVTSGRLLCVFGCEGNRSPQQRLEMGRVAEAAADSIYLTSDHSRGEDPRGIARDVLRGIEQRSAVRVVLERPEAIALALTEARPGDCVLIAGRGHEEYRHENGRRQWVDDRDFAREWLYDIAEPTAFFRAA